MPIFYITTITFLILSNVFCISERVAISFMLLVSGNFPHSSKLKLFPVAVTLRSSSIEDTVIQLFY
jgi:hypothetical protein